MSDFIGTILYLTSYRSPKSVVKTPFYKIPDEQEFYRPKKSFNLTNQIGFLHPKLVCKFIFTITSFMVNLSLSRSGLRRFTMDPNNIERLKELLEIILLVASISSQSPVVILITIGLLVVWLFSNTNKTKDS